MLSPEIWSFNFLKNAYCYFYKQPDIEDVREITIEIINEHFSFLDNDVQVSLHWKGGGVYEFRYHEDDCIVATKLDESALNELKKIVKWGSGVIKQMESEKK